MGSPPPLDFPDPDEQSAISLDASFGPSPSGPTLCGFGLPFLKLGFSLRIPKFPPFAFPPTFAFFLALNCDLSDPIDAHFAYGGGRTPNVNVHDDPEDG